jgi:hypothetical protein
MINLGVARGLEYLHRKFLLSNRLFLLDVQIQAVGQNPEIVHGDLKAVRLSFHIRYVNLTS